MTDTLDLDGLAAQPLVVTLGGKTYELSLTVAAMVKLDAVRNASEEGQAMTFASAFLEASGLPQDVVDGLSMAQANKLSEALSARFFPTAVAAEAVVEIPLTGPTPSSDSVG
jgi:hypothetical protein